MSAPDQPTLPPNGELVFPGDQLCLITDTIIMGQGVHQIDKYIFSSVLGALSCEDIPVDTTASEDDNSETIMTSEETPQEDAPQPKKQLLSVVPLKDQLNLPTIGDIVICRVTEIQARQAYVSIEFIEGQTEPCSQCRGVIRQRDVRHIDTDGVIIYDSFRPGDIIKAAVISLGDTRSYYLSTAKQHLGVIYAENVDGIPMQLILPKEEFKATALVQYMRCPVTNALQPRKAAF